LEGTSGNTSTFTFDFTSNFTTDEEYSFTLIKENEPCDWNSSFTLNGNTYYETGIETIPANTSKTVSIDISPSALAGFAKYTFKTESVSNPNFPPKEITVFIIANTGTLLIHNKGAWSTGRPSDFEGEYFSGFDYASVADYASCSYKMFLLLENNNLLDNIHTVFFNVAWTFPGLTDEICEILSTYLNNGGNLFIAGQDLGWDTWENSGTTITQNFYTNYLNADFQDDGSTESVSICPNPVDNVFGNLNSSALGSVYGISNMYPDEISAVGNGNTILRYLNDPSKGAAVKSTNGVYKVVYLGFDPPMVSD